MWHRHARRWHRHGVHRGMGPWAERGRFFGPGEVRLALLSLLAEGECHGYDLMRRLEERSGGTYRASRTSPGPKKRPRSAQGPMPRWTPWRCQRRA